jgi:hypothetical protein
VMVRMRVSQVPELISTALILYCWRVSLSLRTVGGLWENCLQCHHPSWRLITVIQQVSCTEVSLSLRTAGLLLSCPAHQTLFQTLSVLLEGSACHCRRWV